MAGRTVVCTTDRHRLFKEFNSLNFMTETAGRTVAGTTGRHELRNTDWVGFLLKFKGAIWTIYVQLYEISGQGYLLIYLGVK